MRIVDRYLTGRWVKPFLGALSIFLVLFILIDFFGLVEDLLEHRPSVVSVLQYLLFRTGYGIFFLTPMALLVGGFWTTYGLRKHNEWTISQLTGTAPVEVLRGPLVAIGLLTVILILVNCFLMPEIAQKVQQLDDYTLKNRDPKTPVYRNIHSNLPDGRTIRINVFDPRKRRISGVTISRKTETEINLRIDAAEGTYDPQRGWVLNNVRIRKIGRSGNVKSSGLEERVIPLAPPDVLATVMRMDPRQNDINPVEYRLKDLFTSLTYRSERNMNATTERILLHWKVAFPLTNFVLGLFGLIVGLRTQLGRAGGVGTCLILGLGYWILFSLSVSWGKITGPLFTNLEIFPLVFVYGPTVLALVGVYGVWTLGSEQI